MKARTCYCVSIMHVLRCSFMDTKPYATSPNPDVSISAAPPPKSTTAGGSNSEEHRPQPTVSDPPPEGTTTPSSQPDPTQHKSITGSASQELDPIAELGAGTYVYRCQTITAGGSAHTESGQYVTDVSAGLVVEGTAARADKTEMSGMTASSSFRLASSLATTARSTTSRISATPSTGNAASATTSRSTVSSMPCMLGSCIAALLAVMLIALFE